jgi:hypothetical protein
MLCKLHVNKNNKRSKFAFTGQFRFPTVALPIGKASRILNEQPDGIALEAYSALPHPRRNLTAAIAT